MLPWGTLILSLSVWIILKEHTKQWGHSYGAMGTKQWHYSSPIKRNWLKKSNKLQILHYCRECGLIMTSHGDICSCLSGGTSYLGGMAQLDNIFQVKCKVKYNWRRMCGKIKSLLEGVVCVCYRVHSRALACVCQVRWWDVGESRSR